MSARPGSSPGKDRNLIKVKDSGALEAQSLRLSAVLRKIFMTGDRP
ncbi:hypothetical protein ebA887 [Aromatoleum aromaticum EbN1]|uniref:Uncharacterized protein n=1 Tax=Aromatoleum aromaticum (strain DSM 19018 / LMG 30748 / EbN1) TaxID=76114 RepID=Q5P7W4_AROAE|nr:hypothetical protein ebA887 [Aromatoleum aromaticum EbN1]